MGDLGVIGVGLIGGSLALAWKQAYPTSKILGWDNNQRHLTQAFESGLIDTIASDWKESILSCRCTVLAIPVSAITDLLPKVLSIIPSDHYVVDFGSTKKSIADIVRLLPKRTNYLAAHPMAGTEFSGPSAAMADLYVNKKMIFCDVELTDSKWVTDFRKHCKVLGMTERFVSSSDHDYFISIASHLSHAVSFSLSHTVQDHAELHPNILELAGSGLSSTVRLAKSDADLWSELFVDNRDHILPALDEFIRNTSRLRDLLLNKDKEGIKMYFERARAIRSKLP